MKNGGNQWVLFVKCVVGIELLGGISGLVMSEQVMHWYDRLLQPTFTPPGWVFGVVWPVLYAFLGVVLYRILVVIKNINRVSILGVFFGQMFLNAIWTPIFFGLQQMVLALIVLIGMIVWTAWLVYVFYRSDRLSMWLMGLYGVWLLFALMLNYSLVILN